MTSEERNKRKMKIRQKMNELSENENMISGIHNYCDRWCEHCAFTSRCRVYHMEADSEVETNDDINEQFWEELSLNFEVCFDMIKEHFPDIEPLSDEEAESLYLYEEIDAEKKAREYAMLLHKWMKTNHDYLVEKAEMLSNINQDSLLSLMNALDIVRWYEFFIAAKIQRASLPFIAEELYDSDEDKEDLFINSDQNGSAKVALIAIEKSMQAMVYLHGCLPEKEDDILHFLSQLSQIKKGVMSKFPDAMNFKRPGFDE